jgi:tetratricopeptide (TPR) repeat protein
MMRKHRFFGLISSVLMSLIIVNLTAAEPPGAKPAGGPAVGGIAPPDPVAVARAREEEERARPLREAQQARDQADLDRAAFERVHRAGPLPEDAAKDFAQVITAYELAIDRRTDSVEVLSVVVNAHLRLAGAYQYTGQFDKAVAQVRKAVTLSAGTPAEVETNFELGLMYLQALHDPASALAFLKRAQELVPATMKEPDEQAKWFAATSEMIVRCEQEKGK